MVLVHVGLDLEHEAGELVAVRIDLLPRQRVGVGLGLRREAQEVLQEGLDAEVGEGRPEEDRRELARVDLVDREFVTGPVEQLDIVHEVAVVLLADELVELGSSQLGFYFGDLLRRVGVPIALEGDHVTRLAVEHAAEVAAAADGPVHGVRVDSQDGLDLFHEVERIARLAVELVHEGEDGDVPERADLEQLLRLRLDALGAIDDHDDGIDGHERAVGVFGEVLMARRVEDVDALALVGELEHRGRDGDAALLLDVHPVGDGVARAALALHGAGGLDASRVQQKLLGQRRLAGIRMRDDRERAA